MTFCRNSGPSLTLQIGSGILDLTVHQYTSEKGVRSGKGLRKQMLYAPFCTRDCASHLIPQPYTRRPHYHRSHHHSISAPIIHNNGNRLAPSFSYPLHHRSRLTVNLNSKWIASEAADAALEEIPHAHASLHEGQDGEGEPLCDVSS